VREEARTFTGAGGTTPTLPLLERLAQALGLALSVSLGPQQRRSA
jgi:hypothetical protein